MTQTKARSHPMLLFTAGALFGAVALTVVYRLNRPAIELPIEEWHCTAQHDEKRQLQRAQGVEFETIYACDQWSRR